MFHKSHTQYALKGQKHLAQGKRSDTLGSIA